MRRTVLLFCLSVVVALSSTAVASGVTVVTGNEAPAFVEPPVFPYPALQAWAAMNDGAAIECLLGLVTQYNHRLALGEKLTLVESVFSAAITFELDPLFVASVIAAESSFNPRARSRCGAEGLMQLTKPVQPWLGVDDPYDIRQNVAGGCQYLTHLRRRFHRPDLVLAAYNAGPGRVAALGRVPDIKETKIYVKRVVRLHARLTAEVQSLTRLALERRHFHPFVLA